MSRGREEPPPAGLLPGALAWYATGRFYTAADGSVRDAGYFLHLQGIEGDLFAGEPGEGSAHFTFASAPFAARKLTNGGLTLALDAAGGLDVYLCRRPAGSFDDPASFASGEAVAAFRRVSVVVGATVGGEAGTELVSMNVFTAALVASREFEFAGRRHDFRDLVPHGVTQWGTASAGAATAPAGFVSAVPFVGSAVAVGSGRLLARRARPLPRRAGTALESASPWRTPK